VEEAGRYVEVTCERIREMDAKALRKRRFHRVRMTKTASRRRIESLANWLVRAVDSDRERD